MAIKPTKPTVPPAPSRRDPGADFSTKADTFAAFQSPFADYLNATADFVDGRAEAALAAAIGTTLPTITGRALNMTRVNAGATALEFRTPQQVLADLGVTAAGRALLDDADAAAQRTTLGAQAADATLTSLSGLSLAAGDVLYATGADTLVKLAIGTAGQSLTVNAGATAPEWASGAPSTANVLAATAGLAIGAVGSYAMLHRTSTGTSIPQNTAFAGSGLRYAGINGGAASAAASGGGTSGTSPGGTWLSLGDCAVDAGSNATTLFVRIS